MTESRSFGAPAKINLHLRVGPARADGFHPLLTWMVAVQLLDTILIRPADADAFSCSDPTLPTDGRNLIVKAVAMLRERRAFPSVSIHLEKKIPHGGGLGGGSSDAAATLMALDQMFPDLYGPESTTLADEAARLGSDVPFFLFGPSSICRGRGELIESIPLPRVATWALLMLPDIAVPTAEAYRGFDRLGQARADHVERPPDFFSWLDLPAESLLGHLVNDLEPAAFAMRPALATLRDRLQVQLGRRVCMSGSGSSLFTLYDDQAAAHTAAAAVGQATLKAIPARLG